MDIEELNWLTDVVYIKINQDEMKSVKFNWVMSCDEHLMMTGLINST